MNYKEKLFLEELLDLVKSLESPQDNYDLKAKLAKISDRYSEVDNKENIWAILDEMCGDIPQTYIVCLDYLYAAVKDEAVLKKQLLTLERGVREGTLDLFYAIYYKWQIAHKIFMSYDSKPLYIERSNLNHTMQDKIGEFLQLELQPLKEEERNKDRIVVAITQFLGIKHGPTRNALDYCYTLQKKMNKEVLLFIAAEMPIDSISEYESVGLEYSYFNHINKYEGSFTINYLGENMKGYQYRITEENQQKIREIVQYIYHWKPSLIYNIGSENLLIDYLGSLCNEVTIPLGNIFPISEGPYLILPRKIEERDKEIVDYLESKNQKVIESIFVYKLEEPIKIYKKSDFNIDENEYVIAIVGTRLYQEVDSAFIEILHTILEMDSSIHIVFIGAFSDYEARKEAIGYEDRVDYIGHHKDLRGVLNIADLYLNPIRKGGGTSSVEALAEGVPVITMPQCDVAYSCGEAFYCNSPQEMPELIHKYMSDRDFYESQSRLAKIQAARVVNTQEVIQEILDQID